MFSWGCGEQGELGHGNELKQSDIPLQVECLDEFKITKATANANSTLFLTSSNIFGMFYGGNLLMLHSITDYVPSEIFIGLVSDQKLMVLTHDLQMYEIDSMVEKDGYKQGQYIIVGFQDSLMLFSEDKSIIHWEIISLNKCRKTIYSLSENIDCLSDLNQVFLTLNRIPFLINNDTPLEIKKLSSYYSTPIKIDLSDWIYTKSIAHGCEDLNCNKEYKEEISLHEKGMNSKIFHFLHRYRI